MESNEKIIQEIPQRETWSFELLDLEYRIRTQTFQENGNELNGMCVYLARVCHIATNFPIYKLWE